MIRGYKVTNVGRNRTVGVACCSLKELIEKGSKKLQISDVLEAHLQDGTVVDDENYFRTLPSQTLLILRQPGEEVMTGADIIYNALKCINKDILQVGLNSRRFLEDNVKEKIEILSHVLPDKRDAGGTGDITDELVKFSHRKDHPDWFEDLETNAKTKEEFMTKRCKGRIQSYFYDSRDSVRKSSYYKNDVRAKRYLEWLFIDLSETLKSNKHFGWYFDRGTAKRRNEQQDSPYCKADGTFECQGLWRLDKCAYNNSASSASSPDHRINPYSSREMRILFGMWNLDHRIERSRTIIPAIMDAAKLCVDNKTDQRWRINSEYFADLLFTKTNLKLVHIVCHDKGHHKTAVCDPARFLLNHKDSVDCVIEHLKRESAYCSDERLEKTTKKKRFNFNEVVSHESVIF